MAIDKINFSYPRGTLQSNFDGDAMTALELASKTSKKVDECVELVNGVEQIANEATFIVDNMQNIQEQFITENGDLRNELMTNNNILLSELEGTNLVFKNAVNAELQVTKDNLHSELTNTKNNLTVLTNTFSTEINAVKNEIVVDAKQVITGATQQIKENVDSKLVVMANDGTLSGIINDELFTAIKATIAKNEVVVGEQSPLNSNLWYDVSGETSIEINGEMVVLEEI